VPQSPRADDRHSGLRHEREHAARPFTWQDLVMLKLEIPIQWQDGASSLMNQRTFALLMTISDAVARPLWARLPEGARAFSLAARRSGSPRRCPT
jgi:predicted phage gp36 major capsid-like protein